MTGDSGERKRPSPDKNEVLLGIKYEAARLGGVSEDALAAIAAQARDEIGPEWNWDEGFVTGRNAVRDEHGLDRLGGEPRSAPDPARKSWYGRLKRHLGG